MSARSLPPHEVRTWAEIRDGDRIALPGVSPDGESGHEVMEVARQGALASVRPAVGGRWSEPIVPPPDAPAARTMRGPVTVAIATLTDAGFDIEVIDQ